MKNLKTFHAQALVEFALIIPLFLFMVTFLIDMGRAVISYTEITNAAREGTRFAVVHPHETTDDQDAIIAEALSYISLMDPDDLVVTFSVDEDTDIVTMTITYSYVPVTPGLSLLLAPKETIDLMASSSSSIVPLYMEED